MHKALSDLVHINPQVELPQGLTSRSLVSFVPMANVTEGGEWVGRQVRRLHEVNSGFTSFSNDDVLVAKITPCFENGKGALVTGLMNGIGFGSTEFHVLRARKDVAPGFIFHVTQSAGFRLRAERYMTGSAGQKRVAREAFDVYGLPEFSPGEQRAISATLDTLDITIRQTEAIIEKLRQVNQGLHHDLLTRGIDANGELRPSRKEMPELYTDAACGCLPRHWEASDVAAQFSVASGLSIGPHRLPRFNRHKYLRVANVKRAMLDLGDVAEMEATRGEVADRVLAAGDLLVVEGHASSDEIGRCAIADESVSGYTFQNHLFRLRAINVEPAFALLWLNSSVARAYWRAEAATSSGLNTINRAKLDRLPVAVPPVAEQRRIVAAAFAAEQRLNEECSMLSKLSSTKLGLMDDLLTGRVRVTPLIPT